MDSTASLNPALPFSHPPEHRDRLIQKLLQADAKVVTLRPVIDAKSRAIADGQREDFKSSLAQETARVKLLNNKLSRKDKSGGVNAQTALAEYRSKNVLATLTKAKPWLASSDDRALSLFNSSAGYRARAAETSDMMLIHTDDDVNRTGSPVVTPYDPPSPPPPDDRGRRVFQTGGPTPSYSSSHASSPQRPPSTSLSCSRPPSAASSSPLAASTLSHTASPSRPQSGFSASFSSSRPHTASSVVSSRAPFGGWAHVTTRPLSSKQGFISAEQSIGMEILQRRRCEVLGRSMWRLGKNERSVIAPKGKMEGGNSDFARELKRSQDSKERNLAMLEGLFRWMYLLDEKCNAAFDGSVGDTWEQLVTVAASHNDLVKLKCEKSKLHLADAREGKLGWKHPDPPSTVSFDDPCRYDYFLDWVVEDNRSRGALYTSLSNQWRDAVLGRKAICISPNDHLEWVARIVSWHFDSFPLLPTQELDHELTGRMVIKMFDTFPSAPTKSKLVAMALYLDICGFGPFMPQEMRDALQQNIQSESSPLGSEAQSPTISSISATFSAIGSTDRDANEAANADSATAASHLSKRADEVREAKLDCKDEMGQLYRSAVSALIKEEAVSKAIYGNVLQMHSWSKENEGLFSGTEVGIMLNKVMMTFVAATKAYKSTLVSGVSKLNKKLSLLKQQQQQLKIRVQAAREEAARDEAARKAALIADASILSPTLSSPPLYAKRRGSMKSDAAMQEIDMLLGPAEAFSPMMLRSSSFAKFSLRERRDSSPSLASPSEGRSRRISQYLRDSACRVAVDSPEVFEIPGFEPTSPSPPPLDQEIRQRRTTMDLFKAFTGNVLETEAGQLQALMDTYQTKQLEAAYSHVADDFKDDREHLSVMFRKAVIDARKQRSAHGQPPSAAFTSKISPEDVVTLMHELGESVKLAQVVAFLQPAGYNNAVGPCVSFDDFFGWWCYYQKKVAEEESNGQHTSRSQ